MQDRESQVRDRAYDLWEQAGRPEGRDEEFWHLAWREIEADETGADPVAIDAIADTDNSRRTNRADLDQLTPVQATAATMPGTPDPGVGSAPEMDSRKPL